MKWFKKKNGNQIKVIESEYVPARLPEYGAALENYGTSSYPLERPETLEKLYKAADAKLQKLIATTDKHSLGSEADCIIKNQMAHIQAFHEVAVAECENQVARINTCIDMKKSELDEKLMEGKERKAKLKAEIEPLEKLHSHFQVQIGQKTIPFGCIVTLLAVLFDICIYFGYLQGLILGNGFILATSTVVMALMSDATTAAVAVIISRRRVMDIPKPVLYGTCGLFVLLFMFSVAATIMLKFGSMGLSFGTVDAAGNWIPKETGYTIAEYGVTLLQAFVPICTGCLSFFFSLGDNNYMVSVREKKKKELEKCEEQLSVWTNERALLENCPDPAIRNAKKREAAEKHMEALEKGLELHVRKVMAEMVKDANFTEAMAESGKELLKPEEIHSFKDRFAVVPVKNRVKTS